MDGKWSNCGAWFAVSDDQGTLTLFGTGDKGRYDPLPSEQFFPWDYSPIVHDVHRFVLDERTQQPPHLLPRTIICDVLGRPHDIQPLTAASTYPHSAPLFRVSRALLTVCILFHSRAAERS